VAAAHNEYRHEEALHGKAWPHGRRNAMDDFPTLWADPKSGDYLNNLLVVSASDKDTHVSPGNPYVDWVSFAPGWGISVATGTADNTNDNDWGASYCKLMSGTFPPLYLPPQNGFSLGSVAKIRVRIQQPRSWRAWRHISAVSLASGRRT
jgi:hypothetical protein